jgi:D-mannonate dehydratase
MRGEQHGSHSTQHLGSPDHTPRVEGDTAWGIIGRTFSHGYMRGLVHAVNAMS